MNLKNIAGQSNADFHVHSKYSRDSILRPRKIVEFANRTKKIIAITDHNEIAGALEAKKFDTENRIIIGEEIEITDVGGEVLAYGIQEKIRPGKFQEVVEAIHQQEGLAVLSHPFRTGYLFKKQLPEFPDETIKIIDGVEVYNARNSRTENRLAEELADKYGKIKTRGSDAHMTWELYFFSHNRTWLNLVKNFLTVLIKFFKSI